MKLVRINHSGLPTARNVGLGNATGNIIAFTDADCVVEPQWLEKLVEKLEEGYDGVIGGTVKALNSNSFVTKCLTIRQRNPVKCISGGYNMAYRRKVIAKLGSFKPYFMRAGDYDLNLRAMANGYRIGWAKDATVLFTYPDSINKLIKKQFADGFWFRILLKHHPRHLRERIRNIFLRLLVLLLLFPICMLYLTLTEKQRILN